MTDALWRITFSGRSIYGSLRACHGASPPERLTQPILSRVRPETTASALTILAMILGSVGPREFNEMKLVWEMWSGSEAMAGIRAHHDCWNFHDPKRELILTWSERASVVRSCQDQSPV